MNTRSLGGIWRVYPCDGQGRIIEPGYDITVPGSWKSLPEMAEHQGWVCCRTVFSLSETDVGQWTLLRFGGVCRKARVYLNDRFVGEHDGLQAPFRLDVSDAAASGKNRLDVYVDSRRPEDDYLGFSSIYELIPLRFDGIYDQVTLETGPGEALTGLYTPIEPEAGKALFLLDTLSRQPGPVDVRIELTLSLEGRASWSDSFSARLLPGASQIALEAPLSCFELWSPEHPALYQVRAELTAPSGRDTLRASAGFKQLETRGTDFYLNGQPIYILGFGDDFVYPEGFPPAGDADFFKRRLLRAREYGFNYARCHSHFPLEAYLDAADQAGVLVQPELALANLPREWIGEKQAARFLEEWRGLIAAYRGHPCVAAWCGGNEMEWGFPFSRELYSMAKELDPFRPVQSTDGNFMACDVDDTFDFAGIVPAEYTDYLPYGELRDMFRRDRCGKPQVIHEMGNYTTLPSADETAPSGKNAELIRASRSRFHETQYRRLRENSLALQKLCHKLNVEQARLSPDFCGYHLWTLVDYYGTTQGLLDGEYRDKAFTAGEFARINAQTVLLWDAQSRVFPAGEEARIDLYISRYGSDTPLSGVLRASLAWGDEPVGEWSVPARFSGHGLFPAAEIHATLPLSGAEREYTLCASFRWDGGQIENQWSLFAVPRVSLRRDREIYIHYLSRHLVEGQGVPVRHFTIPQPIGPGQIVVTSHLYGGMLESAERGAALLLLAGEDTFRETSLRNSFKSPWWEAGPIWYLNHSNNDQAACVVEDHPAASMLPYSGAWKLDLFWALEQAPAVNIDALGLDVEPVIYGVNTRMERLCYLFQFALGQGRVVVCSLNHLRRDVEHIEVDYVLKSLINYAMSPACSPRKRLTGAQLREALKR